MDSGPTYTLITGGSRGLGKALAAEFAHRGMNLLLVARNLAALEAASEEIREEFSVSVHILQADLGDPDGPQRVWDWCKKEGYRVNILVNNAGVGGTVRFENAGIEYLSGLIQLNIRSTVLLTRLFLEELKAHPRGYILNIGSLAAYFPVPYKSVYAASKTFMLHFSRALKEELREHPVTVTVVNPNGVRTNTGTSARIDSHSRLASLFFVIDAEKIARLSVDQMLKGKSVVVPGFLNHMALLAYRLVPNIIWERWMSSVFSKEFRKSMDPLSPD